MRRGKRLLAWMLAGMLCISTLTVHAEQGTMPGIVSELEEVPVSEGQETEAEQEQMPENAVPEEPDRKDEVPEESPELPPEEEGTAPEGTGNAENMGSEDPEAGTNKDDEISSDGQIADSEDPSKEESLPEEVPEEEVPEEVPEEEVPEEETPEDNKEGRYGEEALKEKRRMQDILRKIGVGFAKNPVNSKQPRETIYSTVLKSNVGTIDQVDYGSPNWDILDSWSEGILGERGGEQLLCADGTIYHKAGYKYSEDAANTYSKETIQTIAAIMYYYDHYMCSYINDDYDYLFKQVCLWMVLDTVHNWFPGNVVLETGNGVKCGCGRWLSEHNGELRREAIDWAFQHYQDFPDAWGILYKGEGQPLSKWGGTYTPNGSLEIIKYSANPELTNDNSNYSLAGAVYGVYTKDDKTSPKYTITMEEFADGWGPAGVPIGTKYGLGRLENIPAGDYYIKEITPPPGFAKDESWYPGESTPLHVGGSVAVRQKVTDVPQMDPVGVLLGKIDRETNMNKPQGSASLQGAQFTVKYYDYLGDPQVDPAELGKTPERQWVFQTDADGFCYLGDQWLVSGDPFYTSVSGVPSLPIGTITIQETKAPEGYLINHEVFVRQITSDGVAPNIHTYNRPIIPENILKLDLVKKQAGTEIVIPGAVFEHTQPDGTTETFTTDPNGQLTIKGLQYGQHRIREKSAPAGYKVNPNEIVFTVGTDNRITLDSSFDDSQGMVTFHVTNEGNVSVSVEDKLAPFSLQVIKENNKGMKLEGAEFTLYSDASCTQIVDSAVSDHQGVLKFRDLEIGNKYYLKETKAPKGYKIEADAQGNPMVYEVYAESTPVRDEFIFYVNGNAYTSSSDPNGMFTVTGTKEDRIGSIKIINQIGMLLPETGSNWTIPLLLLGSAMMLVAITKKKNAKGEKTMKNKMLIGLLALSMAMTGVMAPFSDTALTVHAATGTTESGIVDFGRGDASITIQGNGTQTLIGKKFNVYMLFNAENSVGGESINYTFNPEYKEALQNVVGKAILKTPSQVTEYEVIDYIQSLNTNVVEGVDAEQVLEGRYSDFRYFVENLRDEIVKLGKTTDVVNVTSVSKNNSVQISGLPYGYYIVDEVSDNAGTHSASSLCMVNTANPNAAVTVKSDFPSIIKKIQEDDQKDVIGNNGWNDIADYEIGQTVPYKFTSNVPNMNGYHTYFYAWHDVMDKALTFNKNSVSIQISDGVKNYTLANSEFAVYENVDGETFKVEVTDLKAIVDREFNKKDALGHNTYGQTVTLTYNATLNDNAAADTGRPGFENDVRLEFSNDPDGTGNGKTGFTPWDTVVCFTYKLNVLKTNNHGLQLENAKFRLYSDKDCKNEVYVKATANGYNVINRDLLSGTDHTGGSAPADAVEMSSKADGTFVIYGLDQGVYYLKETDAPDGYRQILDPIVLTVTPTFTDQRNNYVKGDGATDRTLKTLEYSAYIKQFLSGAFTESDKPLETDVVDGSGNLTVINHVGAKLPVTGSAGTIVMLALGAGLVVVASKIKKTEE